jgi:hypothetical protein
MPLAIHCDRSDCDTWSVAPEDFVYVSYGPGHIKYYCTRWCMVVEESKDIEPTEIV